MEMKREINKNLPTGPRDVKRGLLGLFFSFASPPPRLPPSRCFFVVPLGLAALSRRFELHPFPPREQLLAAVVLGAGVVAVSVVVVVLGQWRRVVRT
jgi:hypothetical protein